MSLISSYKKLTTFHDGTKGYDANIASGTSGSPVVSVSLSRILVLWDQGGDIYYKFGEFNDNGYNGATINWNPNLNTIPNTTGYCRKVSVSNNKSTTDLKTFVAWQQGIDKIFAAGVIFNGNTSLTFNSQWYGSASGFTTNHSPSITACGNTYRLAWIGERTGERRIVTYFNNQFYSFGTSVKSPSISIDGDKSIIAYSDYNGSYSKYALIYYYQQYKNLQLGYGSVQLTPGTSLSNLYASSLNTNTTPYSFNTSANLSSLPKTSSKGTKYIAREGIISNGNSSIYLSIGAVINDNVQFTFNHNDIGKVKISEAEVNNLLETESFRLEKESDLIFTFEYGTGNLETGKKLLQGDNQIVYRAELIDSKDNSVLGTFGKGIITSNNLVEHDKIYFDLNTSDIKEKDVKIRLVIEKNFDAELSIANTYYDEDNLKRINVEEIEFSELNKIEDYSLFANYPNPFNPTTKIDYQLPKSGHVTLKVFNMLGQEVATLVDGVKSEGRYSVNFNAKNLASGTYIYTLQAGDNKVSKKMILLK
ncbi:MAG: T9SS type A sorting domain-containing protein [Melioribacteraceae bacterium]|nr:T9SS type A sorting domain-containing protein [Melioribacteraceae bacterium]